MSNCGEVNTAITKRAIELSVLKWKRSLLICMAKYRSQGRKEQLLLTDQDNALVFQDVARRGMMRLKNILFI
jgi:CBS domain-containing protein